MKIAHKLKHLPKHSKHLLRVSIFLVAAIVIFVLRRHGYTSGFVGISTELVMSTIVDRLFPGGSFLGDIESST